MRHDGNLCYAAVVVAVTVRIILDAHNINVILLVTSKLSFLAFGFFVYIEGLFPELDSSNLLHELSHFHQYHLIVFLLTFQSLPFQKLLEGRALIQQE